MKPRAALIAILIALVVPSALPQKVGAANKVALDFTLHLLGPAPVKGSTPVRNYFALHIDVITTRRFSYTMLMCRAYPKQQPPDMLAPSDVKYDTNFDWLGPRDLTCRYTCPQGMRYQVHMTVPQGATISYSVTVYIESSVSHSLSRVNQGMLV